MALAKVIGMERKRQVQVDVQKLIAQNAEIRELLKQWQAVGADFVSKVKTVCEELEAARFTIRMSGNEHAYTSFSDAVQRLNALVQGG